MEAREHGISEEYLQRNGLCIERFHQFILQEERKVASIESITSRISHGEQLDYSLRDCHLSSECNCRAGWLFSSSSKDMAANT